MAKMFTYIVIMTVMILLLNFSGVLSNSEMGSAANLVNVNQTSGEFTVTDWQDTGLFNLVWALIGALAVAAGAGIRALFFGGSTPSEGIIKAGAVFISSTFLFAYATTIWQVMAKANELSCSAGICGWWLSAVLAVIMIPIGLGYIVTAFEWIGGFD